MIFESKYKTSVLLANFTWVVIAVMTYVAAVLFLSGAGVFTLLPSLCIAMFPALITLILLPNISHEWAQLLIILAWTALAILACITAGMWPMALLFLCGPIAASLFDRAKVIEALFISITCLFVIYAARNLPFFEHRFLTASQLAWSYVTAFLGLIGFGLATLFVSASEDGPQDTLITEPEPLAADQGERRAHTLALHIDDPKTSSTDSLTLQNIFAGGNGSRAKFFDLLNRARDEEFGKQHTQSVLLKNDNGRVVDIAVAYAPTGEMVVHGLEATPREARIRTLEAEHHDVRQNMEDKTLFFSGVSHELRTPLNAIIGFSDMMRSRLFGPLPGKYAEYADLIHESGQHMLDLIGDVLDMSKVEAGKYELHYDTFDIADVIRSTVKMVRPTADAAEVMLKIDVADNQDILVEADRKAIRQILLNLISNAVKFTPKGGLVYISAKVVAETLHLMVSDNGVGMSQEELERIGDPYVQVSSAQTSEHRGSGLGLSLVKSLTDLHKGRFAIASQTGVGTSIDIYIPLHRR